jgi:hypothetical protein
MVKQRGEIENAIEWGEGGLPQGRMLWVGKESSVDQSRASLLKKPQPLLQTPPEDILVPNLSH